MKIFNKLCVSILSAVFLFTALALPAKACTGVIVGSDLTEDGSTIFGRTEDLEINHNKVYKINKAGKYKKGEKLTDVSYAEKGGYEYELDHDSYRFTSISDTTPEYGIFDEAGYNEKGLIADMTVSASANEDIQKVDPYLDGEKEGDPIGISEAIITTVVLSSADNALDAVKLIANEVATKGAAEGNALVVSDKTDTWYVEIYSGHEFAAMKYPKDKFSVFPNTFWLNESKLTKGEESENYIMSEDGNYLYSKTIFDTAKKAKTFEGNEDERIIDLAKSYAEKDFSPSNRSRVASGIKFLNPDSKVDMKTETYEFLQDAKKGSISVKNVMDFTRNRLENFDIEANDRGRDETYPIGNRNTMESHIFQVPENAKATNPGIMWLTLGSPLVQPYIAYYPNQEDAIEEAKNETNDPDKDKSQYWMAMDTLHMVEANRDEFMKDISPEIDKFEKEQIANTKISGEEDPTKTNNENAEKAFDLLKGFNKDLEGKYKDYLKENDYEYTFYGRRDTENFTNTTMEVKKDTSETALNLNIEANEDGKGGKIDIVDNYGNPVEKLNNPVKISVPKKGFEKQPIFEAKDSKIEVKEDSDSYVFETEKTSLNYKNDGEKSENKDNKEEKTESNDSSNEKKDEKKSDKKSNKGLIIGAIVVIAALVAFFKKKK
ncbi:MAG: C69 family dipeptidase [Anaerococcus hydrogenalis]|uniref:C69 family dipeptidase n=1 Tax=Anaerococcus hydrogenalis TaxID=33029 RepID=UPI00290D24F4|nr:C69 family dipeptidase [Anaerococcus hydrogenalis]MDU3687449.1 C69 family dipeptidase [Anaerococcus hydrogenalis]